MDTSIQERVRGSHVLIQNPIQTLTGEGGHSHTGLAVFIYPDLRVTPCTNNECLSSVRIEGRVLKRVAGEGPGGENCWSSLQGWLQVSVDPSLISEDRVGLSSCFFVSWRAPGMTAEVEPGRFPCCVFCICNFHICQEPQIRIQIQNHENKRQLSSRAIN